MWLLLDKLKKRKMEILNFTCIIFGIIIVYTVVRGIKNFFKKGGKNAD